MRRTTSSLGGWGGPPFPYGIARSAALWHLERSIGTFGAERVIDSSDRKPALLKQFPFVECRAFVLGRATSTRHLEPRAKTVTEAPPMMAAPPAGSRGRLWRGCAERVTDGAARSTVSR
jgi:hypothetical protein